jgi:hypothetical protein
VTRIPSGPEYKATRALEQSFRQLGKDRAVEMRTERRRHHRRLALRAVATGVGVLVVGGGVAVGTKVFVQDDGSVGAGQRPPERVQRVPADRRLAEATAADPVERAPWGVRVYQSVQGTTCVVAGRVVGGRLGVLQSGRFKELASDAPGSCANLIEDHLVATVRNYGAVSGGARTVLFGVGDRTVQHVVIDRGGRSTDVPIAADGTFVLAFEGDHVLRSANLRVTSTAGTTVHRLGAGGP